MNLTYAMSVAREVARLGSLAKAARSLRLSPPSVSRLVGELEEELGVRLFNRTTRRLALTVEGELFAKRAGEILDDIETLRAQLLQKEAAPQGTVHLSSVVAFGNELLPAALAAFSEMYPDIDVILDISNRRVDLIEEHVDVAFRIGGAEGLEQSNLIARRVYSQTLLFVATQEFVSRHGHPVSPDEFGKVPMVRFITGQFGQSHLLLGPEDQKVEFRRRGSLVVDSPIAARNAVLTGNYAGLVADYLVTDSIKSGKLVRLAPDWATRPQPIFAVYAHRKLMPSRVRVTLDFLSVYFGRLEKEAA